MSTEATASASAPLERRQRPRIRLDVVQLSTPKEHGDALATLVGLRESSGWTDFLLPMVESTGIMNYLIAKNLTYAVMESPEPFMRWLFFSPSAYVDLLASDYASLLNETVDLKQFEGKDYDEVSEEIFRGILVGLGRDPQTGKRVQA